MTLTVRTDMSFKLILTLLLSVIVAAFIFQNTSVVEIKFLFWTVSMSRALLILTVLVIGMVLSWLLQGYMSLRRKRR